MAKQIESLDYYPFSSRGKITYIKESHLEYWGLIICDREIINYYAWLLVKYGIAINKGSRFGAHITWIRAEEPPNKYLWNKYEGKEINFKYSNYLRWDNGRHAWVDVYCPILNELRQELGLGILPQMAFHLTIGRLINQKKNLKTMPNYKYED